MLSRWTKLAAVVVAALLFAPAGLASIPSAADLALAPRALPELAPAPIEATTGPESCGVFCQRLDVRLEAGPFGGGEPSVVALDAWGNYRNPAELEASKNRFGFTGHLFDRETGTYYAKARYFDPGLGRFLTQDSYLGEIENPPSLHRFLYANANPVRFTDPTGHSSQDLQNEYRLYQQEREIAWCQANPEACAAKAARDAERDRIATVRFAGALQTAGGVSQIAVGAGALAAPEPSGVTKVAGWVAFVRGIDNLITGVHQMFSGQVEEPRTQLVVREGLEKAGVSPETAATVSQWTGALADAGSVAQASKAITPILPSAAATASTAPKSGETAATRIGREAHAAAAADRRAGIYGDFDRVNQSIVDASGKPIQVPHRVDLRTGAPQPGTYMQDAVPDAVSYRRGLIIEDKPLGRPIAKDRQEIIRAIRAYEASQGTLPRRIAIPRYDPATGEFVRTDLHKPADFLPKPK